MQVNQFYRIEMLNCSSVVLPRVAESRWTENCLNLCHLGTFGLNSTFSECLLSYEVQTEYLLHVIKSISITGSNSWSLMIVQYAHSYVYIMCVNDRKLLYIIQRWNVCILFKCCCCPLLGALGLFGYSTSGRQHATADLSSPPPSCQTEGPLPLSVCLPTIQLYTDTHTHSGSWRRWTHTHTNTQWTLLSAESVC